MGQVIAIYSEDCVTTDGHLTFDRCPYFETAAKLREENGLLLESIKTLEAKLNETHVFSAFSCRFERVLCRID